MAIHIVSFTAAGAKLCAKLTDRLEPDCAGFAPKRYCISRNLNPLGDSILDWTSQRFHSGDALVFIGAAGIAVRAVAPMVTSKGTDPAVLCVSDDGKYVIPLLSGHIGGANELAARIAGILHAKAVITTATDNKGMFAIDTWAKKNGYYIPDLNEIKVISSTLLDGGTVGVASTFPILGELPYGLERSTKTPCGIYISLEDASPFSQTLHLVPKCLRVGIGCRQGIEAHTIEKLLLDVLSEYNLPVEALESVASISLKVREQGILALCEAYSLPFRVYSPNELSLVEGEFQSSSFVEEVTGVDNVCERAAVIEGGKLLVPKTADNGVTIAVAQADWRVVF